MDHQFDILQRVDKGYTGIQRNDGIYLQDNRVVQKKNNNGLPHDLKTGVENLSGLSMNDVRVHYHSPLPAQLNAHAYARGTDIHLATGQEKYLPHEAWHVVQQKLGRVKATMQMKDNVPVNHDTQLEKEADMMGTKAMQQNNAVAISTAPVNRSTNIVQRAMGMEIEIPHPVLTASGENYEGDTLVAEHNYFKVVTDYRPGKLGEEEVIYSNIEFVMKHFDQLQGKQSDAEMELNKRINTMHDFFVHIDQSRENTLKKFYPYAKDEGIIFKDNAETSVVGRNTKGIVHGKQPDDLFVHYTIGLRLDDMYDFSATKLATDKNRNTGTRFRAAESLTVANNVAGLLERKAHFGDDELNKLKGFISLVFMHIAAFYDDVENEGQGQVKNRTAALSRVPLGGVFKILPDEIKEKIKENFDEIDQLIADPFAGWNDKRKRRINDQYPWIMIGDYMKSALGMAAPMAQTLVFGGMHETEIDMHTAGDLVPVEIRTFGKHYVNWNELREDALELLRYSRARQKR